MVTTGDIFSGYGGFSEGAQAAGAATKFGANHWAPAISTFRLNHPTAQVFAQDLSEADWQSFPAADMLIAGPSCQGFTRARGRERKGHDKLRNTMWAVPNALEALRPELLIVENVPEVQEWALYDAWISTLGLLGYSHETHVLDAADFGVPQHRVRWFCVATRSNTPLAIGRLLQQSMRPRRAAAECIDWQFPRWSPVAKPGRSPKALRQIARGRREIGPRFLMPYYGSGSGLTGRSLDRPIGTIVAQDIWAIVDGERMRMLQPHEAKLLMGFPSSFQATGTRREQMRGYGNAVCPPVATALCSAILAS